LIRMTDWGRTSPVPKSTNFSREEPFRLGGLSYMTG
jgi:hypothetical protein